MQNGYSAQPQSSSVINMYFSQIIYVYRHVSFSICISCLFRVVYIPVRDSIISNVMELRQTMRIFDSFFMTMMMCNTSVMCVH